MSNYPNHSQDPNKPDQNHEQPNGPEESEEGGAVQVHEAFLRHREGSGRVVELPTAYAEALEQFEQLPGALRSIPPKAEPLSRDDQSEDSDERASDDEDSAS